MTLEEAKELVLLGYNLNPSLKQNQAAVMLLDVLSSYERREPAVTALLKAEKAFSAGQNPGRSNDVEFKTLTYHLVRAAQRLGSWRP